MIRRPWIVATLGGISFGPIQFVTDILVFEPSTSIVLLCAVGDAIVSILLIRFLLWLNWWLSR